MYIELFVVAGQSVELENALKKVVEDLRGQVQRPDKVRLATVKIRPDAVDQVLKLLGEPPEKIPPHYRSLVNMLKKYGISRFPAVVIDGVKIGEGNVSLEDVLRAVQERAKAEFPELTIELVPPKPTPAPIQQVISELPPPPQLPPPPPPLPPLPPSGSEVRPLELPVVERRPAVEIWSSPPPPPPPPSVAARQITAVVRLILGRPDNCGECAYYGALTSRCFLFGFAVANPASPPCKQYVGSGG